MKIKIKVHPNSSREDIRKSPRTPAGPLYEAWLREKPVDNKANAKLIKLLKDYFGKPVKITSGFTSRNKIIEIK